MATTRWARKPRLALLIAADWGNGVRFPAIAPAGVPKRPAASRFSLIGSSSFAPSSASNEAVLLLI
jgi:hypothetical protein